MTRFGLSTAIFGDKRAGAREFDLIAGRGFTSVELVAGPGRFDVRDPAHVTQVRTWAAASGLEVASVSVALADASLALHGIAEFGCPLLVACAGHCAAHRSPSPPAAPDLGALRRALDHVTDHAAECGIALAVEFPTTVSADDAVALIESLEGAPIGVCLDVGHAHVAGGAPEAIEILSGYILTTHLHDNDGRADSHRPPFSGSVDWPATLMALWKTGYTGPAILEVIADPDLTTALSRTVGARTRLQAILDDLAQPMVFPE